MRLRGLKFDWLSVVKRVQTFVRAMFGEFRYSPPSWIGRSRDRLAGTRFGKWFGAQLVKLRANPKKTAKIAGGVVAMAVAGFFSYQQIIKYLDSLPKPDYVSVSVGRPNEPNIETGQNDHLTISFSNSAARMDELDKPLQDGVEIAPDIHGSWQWVSDRFLKFTPTEPWQIGQKYTVTFKRRLFPEHVLLGEMTYSFETP